MPLSFRDLEEIFHRLQHIFKSHSIFNIFHILRNNQAQIISTQKLHVKGNFTNE